MVPSQKHLIDRMKFSQLSLPFWTAVWLKWFENVKCFKHLKVITLECNEWVASSNIFLLILTAIDFGINFRQHYFVNFQPLFSCEILPLLKFNFWQFFFWCLVCRAPVQKSPNVISIVTVIRCHKYHRARTIARVFLQPNLSCRPRIQAVMEWFLSLGILFLVKW